jgi:hypothetical protein
MKDKAKNLTFTCRQHDILHELIHNAIKENPDDDELLYLYGAVCSIWYKEIYCEPEKHLASGWN